MGRILYPDRIREGMTMPRIDPNAYPPALAELLSRLPLAPLGPGKPDASVRAALEALSDLSATCRAGLWLAFDFLDESHAISQDIDTPDGSFWHSILHRREPDASNAAYWFRRVGEHPVFAVLARDAGELGMQPAPARWDPFHFIDLCEKNRGAGTEQELLLRRVQRREWELLFDWCFLGATGRK
jgi:hypothetical protein